jgi:glutamyl-tRNA synthetase
MMRGVTMTMTPIPRVRFAPSPTGFLHVGGLRTALYNYLYARKHGGTFILRIEDTDRSRFVPGAIEQLIAMLRWSGLDFDEGPEVGGPHASYLQSERLDLYHAEVRKLLDNGSAYRCFCTPERLEEMKLAQQKAKLPPRYDRTCLGLARDEVDRRAAAGAPHVVRMRVPDGETIVVHDDIRGDVEFEASALDDQVLLKSDGYPTYHLANVVDDHEMEISHVIRGEEWLPSTPKHVLLYRFFGYESPRFAHLPLLLNPDRSKLSKRQGDVAVEDYRAKGFLPEALINFVALLGWSPGDEREVFSLEELVREFSLERVNKAGAVFNLDKLRWFNQVYIRKMPLDRLLAELRPHLLERGYGGFPDDYHRRVIDLMRERVTFVRDLVSESAWFYVDPEQYEPESVQKRWTVESPRLLRRLLPLLESLPKFEQSALEESVRTFAEREGVKAGDVVHPLRLAASGVGRGPGLYEMLETLGREASLRRIRRALEHLPASPV